MKIVQITPGAGGMFCGGCFRDNALVAAWRRQGKDVLMLPLYLPLTLEEEDQTSGAPVFFSGVNVYLEQRLPWLEKMPHWLHRFLASSLMLKWAARGAAKTRPADVGDLTLSMLQGESGRQRRELDELTHWLKHHEKPDLISLSNALLLGMARQLRSELQVPIVCTLQGEDTFLDALPEPYRTQCWSTLRERAREVDCFIAPSRYYADLMTERLSLRPEQVHMVHNGIRLDGYPLPAISSESAMSSSASREAQPLVLGYFARLCTEKGIESIVSAYLHLRQRQRVPGLRLHLGGGLGPADKPLVDRLLQKIQAAGFAADVQLFPNLNREQKIEFLKGLTVFSTPAEYGEAFGLYVIEAMACGVPVVQPRHAAFPELIEATQGGLLCEPGNPEGLAEAIETLLLDSGRRQEMGGRGHQAAHQHFGVDRMAESIARQFEAILSASNPVSQ